MSRNNECNAPRVSRVPTGLLVRFVTLLVRFISKIGQSTTRRAPVAPGAGGSGATVGVRARIAVNGYNVSAPAQIGAFRPTNRALGP
jgi:hypothetical protein